jgi:hypothetical protein
MKINNKEKIKLIIVWVRDRLISIFISAFFLSLVYISAHIAITGRYESKSIPVGVRVSVALNTNDKFLSYAQEVSLFARQIKDAYGISSKKSVTFSDWILQSSAYSDVPEILLASLIMTESSFRTKVVSTVGAVGPGQIRMIFWKDSCPNAEHSPKDNVICAGLILRTYYDNVCKQNWSCALQVYNVGPSNFKYSYRFQKAGKRYLKKISGYVALLHEESSGEDLFNTDFMLN